MEDNGFGGNSKLFLFGIICLVLSLGLLLYSLYILPYFIWGFSYHIPDFILNLLATLQEDYYYTSAGSKTIVWLLFFVPCVIAGIISYFVSHALDSKMYGIEVVKEEQEKSEGEIQKQIKESASLGGKILGLMVVIVLAILLLQYFVQSTV